MRYSNILLSMMSVQKNLRIPPGPDEPVSLGIDAETLTTLQQLQRDYGDMVCVKKPNGRTAYFINDATEVRRILTRRHSKYHKGPGFERVKMLLGNGLIVSDGDVWRRSRRMIQPAFGRQNVHRLMKVMVACSDRRAAHWAELARNNEHCNITSETSDFALELILISIFSTDYETRILTEGENPFAFLSRDSTRDLSVVMKVRHLRELLLPILTRGGDASELPRDLEELEGAAAAVLLGDHNPLSKLGSVIGNQLNSQLNNLRNMGSNLMGAANLTRGPNLPKEQRFKQDIAALLADPVWTSNMT